MIRLRLSSSGRIRTIQICLLAAAGVIGTAVVLLALSSDSEPVPSFAEVRAGYQKSDALLLDRWGAPLQELRLDMSSRRLDWMPLSRISPAILKSVVFAEDRRFHRHRGVDWLALAGAGFDALLGRGVRGASTLTMQVVNLTEGLAGGGRYRGGWLAKWSQIRRAQLLERSWTKEEILEAYLNLVSFRGELRGISAGSLGLFARQPHGLTDSESVVLSVLLRAPNAAPEKVIARAERLREARGLPPDPLLRSSVEQALLHPHRITPAASLAPQLARRLLPAAGKSAASGSALRSTLDRSLQEFAAEALRYRLRELSAQNVRDGAVLVVDNATGDVLAYVANAGAESSARHVDGIAAPRQAGSVLKPFLYALALERRLMTPLSLLDDSPVDIPVTGGIYRPRNYDSQFSGLVPARVALASSLNVPAVKTLLLVGVEAFLQRLKQAGFEGLRSGDFYGPSLALGSADITLWDLVNGYRMLANGGRWSALRLRMDEPVPAARSVYTGEAAFLVSDMLSDRESRSHTFSLESPLAPGFWAAVKTGTSKDMRDNWCVGYSRRYTVGVWVGNFSGVSMWNVSGMSGSAPVWLDLMKHLHRDDPGATPPPPAGVVARSVEWGGSQRQEWFLAGTEHDAVERASSSVRHRIRYPAPGSVFALDPDIPREEQRLFFEADPPDGRFGWSLDGQALGPADSLRPWRMEGGAHELTLLDERNQVVDSVRFEVRGSRQQTGER